MILVIISWVIFAFDDFSKVIAYLGAMFGANGTGLMNNESIYLLYTNLLLFAILFFASMDWGKRLWAKFCKKFTSRPLAVEVVKNVAFIIVFILSVAYLVNASYNPFLYFRF